jgi:hypothetical protein
MPAFHTILLTLFLLQAPHPGTPNATPELSVVLQPEAIVNGLPQAFTFTLTNTSGKDLRLPQPSLNCSNGSIMLTVSWLPLTELGTAGAVFCDSVGSGLPISIAEHAKTWKLLKAGESLYIHADNRQLHYDTTRDGRYIFSAVYLPPPTLSEAQQEELKEAGISIPQHKAFSQKLEYRK